jgi:hypothetical protein
MSISHACPPSIPLSYTGFQTCPRFLMRPKILTRV